MKIFKGTSLYSIFTGKCPVCQTEKMYKKENPYKLKSVFEMHEKCSNCGTKYQMEPSFFYGAMYVSYALGVAIGIAVFIVSYLFLNTNLITSFLLICVFVIGLLPVEMRLSRNIWINLFLKYDKTKANNKEN